MPLTPSTLRANPLIPANAQHEYDRLARAGQRVSLIHRPDGACLDFSAAWIGTNSKSELLGLRWLEYIDTRDVTRLLLWLARPADGSRCYYRGMGILGRRPRRFTVVLVKQDFHAIALCGGDARPSLREDRDFF